MACVIYESCPNGSDRFPVTDSHPSTHGLAGGPPFPSEEGSRCGILCKQVWLY